MEDQNRFKDPVTFAEEVLGIKLLESQKTVLRKMHEARENGQELIIHYPYRHGRTTINKVINEFYKTR